MIEQRQAESRVSQEASVASTIEDRQSRARQLYEQARHLESLRKRRRGATQTGQERTLETQRCADAAGSRPCLPADADPNAAHACGLSLGAHLGRATASKPAWARDSFRP